MAATRTIPTAPRPRPARAAGAAGKVPWGWLEWALLAQTALPALLFIPGISPLRIVTRVGVYAISLIAWGAISMRGARARPGARPAVPWLIAASVCLFLALANPGLNSPASGIAHIFLNLAILAPAFWGAAALTSRRQVGRLMAILLVGNACSALVGIGQVVRPGIFNPPNIEMSKEMYGDDDLTFEAADGSKIMRPCGLSDSPGIGSSSAGLLAAMMGIGWTLRPLATWKRLICLGLALAGLIILYFSQVRLMLLILIGSGLTLMGLLAAQREFRKLTLMGGACALIFVGAIGWVASVGGEGAMARYQALLDDDPGEVFHQNRGGFLMQTFSMLLPNYPLGAGLGRWGQMYSYFGDKSISETHGQIWAELQITGWAIDGGFPLMVLYMGALAVAMIDLGRIALNGRDRDLSYWAAVVFALDLGIIASTFGMPTYVTPLGLQFWVLAAAVSAADRLPIAPAPAPARPSRAA